MLPCSDLEIFHLKCQMIICEPEQFPGVGWWAAYAFQTTDILHYLEIANKWEFFLLSSFVQTKSLVA